MTLAGTSGNANDQMHIASRAGDCWSAHKEYRVYTRPIARPFVRLQAHATALVMSCVGGLVLALSAASDAGLGAAATRPHRRLAGPPAARVRLRRTCAINL